MVCNTVQWPLTMTVPRLRRRGSPPVARRSVHWLLSGQTQKRLGCRTSPCPGRGRSLLSRFMTDNGPRGPSVRRVPEGDNRERTICAECGFVLYDNPKIVVGSVVRWGLHHEKEARVTGDLTTRCSPPDPTNGIGE